MDRKYMIDFWTKNKSELNSISSIKLVYKKYTDSDIPDGIQRINEYKFRKYIRKNGYCNSCTIVKCKKCKKNILNNN